MASKDDPDGSIANGSDLWIASEAGGNNAIQATIDDMRIYSVALTAEEVAAIYNNGDGDFGTGDLIVSFQGGGFEIGPRPSVAVPEPATGLLLLIGLLALAANAIAG